MIDCKSVYYLDYIELKNIKQKPYKNLYKDNDFLENALYVRSKIILSKKINIYGALKSIYQVVTKYVEKHYNPIPEFKNYTIRVIMDYLTFVISENFNHLTEKLDILNPNEILSLTNYELYPILVKNEDLPNVIYLPKNVINYIQCVKQNDREIIRELLFI